MKVKWNVTKGPLSHQKMKCSFLGYIQLLMISRAIRCPPPQQKKLDFFKSTFLTWPKYTPLRNLSRISTVLHQTFRTGLIFLIRSKWVQGVVCYDWNLQKCKYLNEISTVLHETFRTGLIFLAGWNESKEWYAMIETYKNINISAEYQRFCMKPSEQGSFFWASWNKSKEWYAMTETYEDINISMEMSFL